MLRTESTSGIRTFHLMQMDTAQIDLIDSEEERVIEWREQELTRAGYTAAAARALARRHDVDLHKAVDLLRSGCDPELAVRILL